MKRKIKVYRMKKIIKYTPKLDGENGWLATTPDANKLFSEPLKGNHQFDVVIIGAGFTGISTALRLAENNPSLKIALIDALQIGQGTSGRNAGFLSDIPHHLDANLYSKKEIEQSISLSAFALNKLKAYKDHYQIPHWDDAGKYLSAREGENVALLKKFIKALEYSGIEYEWLSGNPLQKRLGTPYYRASVYTKGAALVNPATLIRGLIAALPESVTLFENSPVSAIDYQQPLHKVHFVGGSINAEKVILTTNAYLSAFGIAGNKTLPIFTYASLTAPLSSDQISQYFQDISAWGTTPAHHAGTTVRLTPDHRIFIRNSFDYLPTLQADAAKREKAWQIHRQSFLARFPFLVNNEFQYTWGGMISLTRNQAPQFATPYKNVYLISGCNGSGVIKGFYLGYYLADYLSKIESENLRFILKTANPNWLPKGPIRHIVTSYRIPRDTKAARGDV